jgi:cell wall-associated NlpC family hydrolase
MYIGGGQMIHSPKTVRSVEVISMNTPEYAAEFAGARRYIGF